MLLLIFARRVLLLEGWQQETRPGTFAFAERIQYILIHYTSHTSLGWARVVTGARWDQTNLVLFRALAHRCDLHAEQAFATTLENICVNN